jgi:hydroxylaminobenzene mutase
MTEDPLRRRLAFNGAVLFTVGIVTGLWSAVALAGKVTVGIPHLALAAHLNGLLGGLWLVAIAFTLPFLSYGDRGKRWLSRTALLATYANWLVTLLASVLGVRGIDYTGDHANDFIAVLLQAFVVLPSFAACGFWVWGFRKPASAA